MTSEKPELRKGPALCLSGGGYRAMVFHLGCLWRLNQAGYLPKLQRISSVSGGSITAGVLALHWKDLRFNAAGVAENFVDAIAGPVRSLAAETIDVPSITEAAILPGGVSNYIQRNYRKYLFGHATLQDIPDEPRFVFCATSVQSMVLWRFSKKYMGDYRVGLIPNPKVELATAVAASSAFPPVLSPCTVDLDPKSFDASTAGDLHKPPYTEKAVLTDGGVYDNLGLEPIWKDYDTILVSDGGGGYHPEENPHHDWARHGYRVFNMVDSQVRALRKRQVVGSFAAKERAGTYWGIRTDITNYGVDSLPCSFTESMKLAETPTRLKQMPAELQERLVNWGYAVTDAALRAHVDQSIPRGQFPYARGIAATA